MPVQQPPILQNQVVVFSKNYLPLARINIKRAIALLITGQAESLSYSGKFWEVRSPSVVLQIPEHIRLTSGKSERHWKVPPVSRREVLRRDNHRCQYCDSTKHLTLDHVIPRSKGGQHRWDNVVIACATCNSIKGDRLLNEIKMTLRSKPKAPMHPAIAFAEQFWKEQAEPDGMESN
jgi:5-methylcytosine-specific restriction endonuclease McrA